MIHYFTNREISKKLEINLARWKRWSRSFLPPDPLGGMQSGYARQYTLKDLMKVYLGGHVLTHLKLSVPESQQVLHDLVPWLKKAGFLDLNGSIDLQATRMKMEKPHRIYFRSLPKANPKNGISFGYLIRQTLGSQLGASSTGPCVTEILSETFVNSDTTDGWVFLQDPNVRMINLTAVCTELIEKLA